MNIDGKVIVITGAARGIGQEYARYLGGLGARIVAADINDCSSTLDLVKAESGTAVGAKLDVASAPSAMEVAGSRAAGSTPSASPIGTRPWP
jgi:3-oxoacyl-[acyl-carrier protein] reductase